MNLADICAIDIGSIATKDSVLFLWATAPLLPQALEVMRAWGFEYKSQFVWDKVKHSMGHYNSVRHELLLIGTKGRCLPEVSKLFDSVQSIERSPKHSEKPVQFRRIIDTLYPSGRRLELFARGKMPDGWTGWALTSGFVMAEESQQDGGKAILARAARLRAETGPGAHAGRDSGRTLKTETPGRLWEGRRLHVRPVFAKSQGRGRSVAVLPWLLP